MRQRKSTRIAKTKFPSYYREELWDRLAWLYDPFVRLIFLPCGGERAFRRRFVDFAHPQKGDLLLDVCCGTGTLTSLLAEKVFPGGQVIGVDLSPGMLRIAREKIAGTIAAFGRANTEQLPFRDSRFAKAFISLALHEMPEIARQNTLKEIYRTLTPEGRLFILDYSLPERWLWRSLLRLWVKLFEEESAGKLVLKGDLMGELQAAGFKVERRIPVYVGMLQMICARKS